ncbi:variant surface glycoprotein (VSG), putative [Trypanosoma brucei brucei TREU927]|uniref:Variant surface glycoprotein (VSG), putative n=1 Tax=Trypanosoma brucei brucei (strain 927/4 GUTat10.1) TaxID=185431 RepID=Q4FKU4_TRYB2|nr:variant surface glycoprotein [Trypanosoma brucei brucei TREU927]EAN76244.1 variant surface glycoprotein (VSG), putative [Trypanosoma brucei brucei TREU927]CAJ16236.1 variant surface glycoprotein (VSG), putative [Trypanosoma brucei brucei TREU927]
MCKTKSSSSLGAYTFLTLITLIAVSGTDTPEEITKDACGSAAFLRIVADTVKSGLLAAVKRNNELNKRLAQATAAVRNQQRPDLGKAAMALLPILAKKAAEETSAALAMPTRALPGLVAAANYSGQQQALAALLTTEVADSTTGQSDVGSAASGTANIKFKLSQTNGLTSCASSVNKAADKHASWATVPGLKKFSIHSPEPEVSASDNRFLAVGKGSGNGQQCDVNGGTNKQFTVTSSHVCIAGGPVFSAAQKQLDAGTSGDYGRGHISSYSETDEDHFAKQAATDIKTAVNALASRAGAFDPNELSSYDADPDFQAAVGAIYGNLPRDKATGEAKNTVSNLITQHFGKAQNFKSKIWDEIEKLKVPATVLGDKAEMTLKDVDDIGLATHIMVQHITASFQKSAPQAEKQPDTTEVKPGKAEETKKTADECKKHTTSEDCKKEKGCDFVEKKPEGEKCFPKVETDKKDEENNGKESSDRKDKP